jgi:hypothetical protein
MVVRLASRDYAKTSVTLGEYHGEYTARCASDENVTILSIALCDIDLYQRERVLACLGGVLETNPMLAQVGCGLRIVPLEFVALLQVMDTISTRKAMRGVMGAML